MNRSFQYVITKTCTRKKNLFRFTQWLPWESGKQLSSVDNLLLQELPLYYHLEYYSSQKEAKIPILQYEKHATLLCTTNEKQVATKDVLNVIEYDKCLIYTHK